MLAAAPRMPAMGDTSCMYSGHTVEEAESTKGVYHRKKHVSHALTTLRRWILQETLIALTTLPR